MNNGTHPDDLDSRLLTELQERIDTDQASLAAVEVERTRLMESVRRYQRALDALKGESRRGRTPVTVSNGGDDDDDGNDDQPPKPRSRRQRSPGISPERLEELRGWILDYSQDHDEFRQVDIRARYLAGKDSGRMAMGFEALRQAGVIRFARRDGNNKWYRLTDATVREREAADATES